MVKVEQKSNTFHPLQAFLLDLVKVRSINASNEVPDLAGGCEEKHWWELEQPAEYELITRCSSFLGFHNERSYCPGTPRTSVLPPVAVVARRSKEALHSVASCDTARYGAPLCGKVQ